MRLFPVLPALVLASLLATPVAAQDPPPPCDEQACPDPRWEAPRILGAYDILPGDLRPFQVLVEPISWNLGAWNFAPQIALSAPIAVTPALELDAWHLQLGAWWMPSGPKVRWRLGPELGLCLRSYTEGEDELLRDWLPAVGLRAGLSRMVFERWHLEAGLRLVGEVPPTDLSLLDPAVELPLWRFQVLLGVHLPSPGR